MRRISLLMSCLLAALTLTFSACNCGGDDKPKTCKVPAEDEITQNISSTLGNPVAFSSTSFNVSIDFGLPVDLGPSNVTAVSTSSAAVTLTASNFNTSDNIVWTFQLATLQPGTTYNVTFSDVMRSDCNSQAMDPLSYLLRVGACSNYDLGLAAGSFKRYNTYSSTAGLSNEISSKEIDLNKAGTGTEIPVIELDNSAATCNQADLGIGMAFSIINNQCDWVPNGTTDAVVALMYERRGTQYGNPGVSEPDGDPQDAFLGGWVWALTTTGIPGNGATTEVKRTFPLIYKRSSATPSCFPNEMLDLELVNPAANYGFSFFMWGYGSTGYVALSQDGGTDAANLEQKALTLADFKIVNSNARQTYFRVKNVYADATDDKHRVACALFNGMTNYDSAEPGVDLLPFNMGSEGASSPVGEDGTANETWDTLNNFSKFFYNTVGGMNTPVTKAFADAFRPQTSQNTPSFLSVMADYALMTPISLSRADQTDRWPDNATDNTVGIINTLKNMLGEHFRRSYGTGSGAKLLNGSIAETDNNGDYTARFALVPGRNYYFRCSPMPDMMISRGDKNATPTAASTLSTTNTLTYRLEISYNQSSAPAIPAAPTPFSGSAQIHRVLCNDATIRENTCTGATAPNYTIDGTAGVHQKDDYFTSTTGVHWYKIVVN